MENGKGEYIMNIANLEALNDKFDKFLGELDNNKKEELWLLRKLDNIQYNIKHKIDELKEVETQSTEIKLPSWVNEGDYTIKEHEGVIYAITKFKKDNDDSFHVYSYSYIPHNNGYIELCVRLLGNDSYGNRIYVSTSYYKTRIAFYSYYGKGYGKNRYPDKFNKNVDFILEEFNKLPEINDSFKIKGINSK